MNKLTTLAVTALTMFGTIQAMAADVSAPLTRAQVLAETQRALAAGELSGGDSFSFPSSAAPAATKLSREAVKAEYRRALAAGEVNQGDSLSFPFEQRAESKLTRVEVLAEYVRARQAGEVVETDVDGAVTHQRGVM